MAVIRVPLFLLVPCRVIFLQYRFLVLLIVTKRGLSSRHSWGLLLARAIGYTAFLLWFLKITIVYRDPETPYCIISLLFEFIRLYEVASTSNCIFVCLQVQRFVLASLDDVLKQPWYDIPLSILLGFQDRSQARRPAQLNIEKSQAVLGPPYLV